MRFSGQLLREKRLQAGKRPETLAVEVKRSYAAITGYEAGRRFPTMQTVCRLADALGCDPGEFFEREAQAV